MKLEFIFNVEPKAIQSARFCKRGKFIKVYQPKANIDWKNYIKEQAKLQLPLGFKLITRAIVITKCHFVFSVLKSMPKYKIKQIKDGEIIYKTTKPDLTDNLFKGLIDALSGTVYKDDALIVKTNNSAKYYGIEAKIELNIETLTS